MKKTLNEEKRRILQIMNLINEQINDLHKADNKPEPEEDIYNNILQILLEKIQELGINGNLTKDMTGIPMIKINPSDTNQQYPIFEGLIIHIDKSTGDIVISEWYEGHGEEIFRNSDFVPNKWNPTEKNYEVLDFNGVMEEIIKQKEHLDTKDNELPNR